MDALCCAAMYRNWKPHLVDRQCLYVQIIFLLSTAASVEESPLKQVKMEQQDDPKESPEILDWVKAYDTTFEWGLIPSSLPNFSLKTTLPRVLVARV